MGTSRTITIEIKATDSTELLELIDLVVEKIEEEEFLKLKSFNVSSEDLIKEQFCFAECIENKKNCGCYLETQGCDKYHQLKDDGQL